MYKASIKGNEKYFKGRIIEQRKSKIYRIKNNCFDIHIRRRFNIINVIWTLKRRRVLTGLYLYISNALATDVAPHKASTNNILIE